MRITQTARQLLKTLAILLTLGLPLAACSGPPQVPATGPAPNVIIKRDPDTPGRLTVSVDTAAAPALDAAQAAPVAEAQTAGQLTAPTAIVVSSNSQAANGHDNAPKDNRIYTSKAPGDRLAFKPHDNVFGAEIRFSSGHFCQKCYILNSDEGGFIHGGAIGKPFPEEIRKQKLTKVVNINDLPWEKPETADSKPACEDETHGRNCRPHYDTGNYGGTIPFGPDDEIVGVKILSQDGKTTICDGGCHVAKAAFRGHVVDGSVNPWAGQVTSGLREVDNDGTPLPAAKPVDDGISTATNPDGSDSRPIAPGEAAFGSYLKFEGGHYCRNCYVTAEVTRAFGKGGTVFGGAKRMPSADEIAQQGLTAVTDINSLPKEK